MLFETLNYFLLGFDKNERLHLQSVFHDGRTLSNLFSCTFVSGVKRFLKVREEKKEKLLQPRRAEACYGRVKQVLFEEENGEGNKKLLVKEENAPCVSDISTDSISWNELPTSLHKADIGLKLAGECKCPSLS